MKIKNKKNKKYGKISFDASYSFLDSKNLAKFNKDKFEGVLEKPLERKDFFLLLILFILIILFFFIKVFYFQIINGEEYTKKAKANFTRNFVLFSERGVVFDRNKKELIWNEKNLEENFSKRNYINQLGFSHLLGFLSYPQKDRSKKYFEKEYVGKSGVERYFNDKLNGKIGSRIVKVDSFGKIILNNVVDKTKAGENIILSIDSILQNKMAIALNNYIKEYGFTGGAGGVMDIKNGEVLAMFSLPEYSSKILTEGEDRKKIKAYLEDTRNPFLNKFLHGEYTPGSIVKPFIALAGLENNIIKENEKILTNGRIVIPNRFHPENPSIFRDSRNHGIVDLKKAIANSSNVYFYIVGGGILNGRKGLGIEKLEANFKNFGFGQETEFQFFIGKKGQIPNPEWKKKIFLNAKPWGIGNTYNTSIGQFGFLVTPIQTLVGVSAIANNGEVLKPKIIKGEKKEIKNNIFFSQNDFKVVRRAMRETVLNGTTQTLNFNFLKIASKSGTAQIKRKTRVNSWVIGFFPYENPKYAFVFLAENGPKKTIYGVSNAAREFFLEIEKEGLGKKYFK